MPSPFCVLFIGANVETHDFMELEKESKRVEQALLSEHGLEKWRGRVEFKADCFADPASFMFGLSKLKPSVVQLSCHGDREGIWISGGLVERGKIVQALVAYNKDRTKL